MSRDFVPMSLFLFWFSCCCALLVVPFFHCSPFFLERVSTFTTPSAEKDGSLPKRSGVALRIVKGTQRKLLEGDAPPLCFLFFPGDTPKWCPPTLPSKPQARSTFRKALFRCRKSANGYVPKTSTLTAQVLSPDFDESPLKPGTPS